MWAPFEKQKVEVYIFCQSHSFRFCKWEFATKEDLNERKQFLLLNLRLWLAQKPKVLSSFTGKSLYKKYLRCKSFRALKLVFLICLLDPCHRSCRIYRGLVADMWHIWNVAQFWFNWITNPASWHGSSGYFTSNATANHFRNLFQIRRV